MNSLLSFGHSSNLRYCCPPCPWRNLELATVQRQHRMSRCNRDASCVLIRNCAFARRQMFALCFCNVGLGRTLYERTGYLVGLLKYWCQLCSWEFNTKIITFAIVLFSLPYILQFYQRDDAMSLRQSTKWQSANILLWLMRECLTFQQYCAVKSSSHHVMNLRFRCEKGHRWWRSHDLSSPCSSSPW